MTKLIGLAAAAMLGAGIFTVTPAVAQPSIEFGIDERGRPQFGVRDREAERRARWRERREWERRQEWRDRRRYGAYGDYGRGGYRSVSRGCRLVTIEEEDRWGRSVVRRIRRC